MSGKGEGASGPSPVATSGIDTALDTPFQRRIRSLEVGDLDVTVSALKRRIGVSHLVAPTVGALAAPSGSCGGARRMKLLDDLVQTIREVVGTLTPKSPFARPLAMLGAHFGRKCGQEDAFGTAATRAALGGACIERALAEIEALCHAHGPVADHDALRTVFEKCETAGPQALGRYDHLMLCDGAAALKERFGCADVEDAAAGAAVALR